MSHAKTASDPQQVMGKQLANTLIGGTAVGAGATGLWMLAKYLKNKANEKRDPSITDIATAPLVVPQQKIAEDNLAQLLALPAAGAGVGALLGAVRGRQGNKLRSALAGAGAGGLTGAAGAALMSDAAHKFIGEHIPNFGPSWGERAGKGNPDDPRSSNAGQFAARALGGITLGGLGAYGGSKMIDAVAKHDNSEQNRNDVQKARQEYFDALLNSEKHAGIGSALADVWEKIKSVGDSAAHATLVDIPGATLTAGGLAALGAGGVGAKYMYDKTRAQSQAKLRARAVAARERLKGLDSPWVDPQELAQIKTLTANNGPVHAQGM